MLDDPQRAAVLRDLVGGQAQRRLDWTAALVEEEADELRLYPDLPTFAQAVISGADVVGPGSASARYKPTSWYRLLLVQ